MGEFSDDDRCNAQIMNILDELDKDIEMEDEECPKQKGRRRMKVKAILREFTHLSSTHGVDHIGEAFNCKVMLFWSAILLTCMGLFGYLLYTTLQRFFKYEVTVDLAVQVFELGS